MADQNVFNLIKIRLACVRLTGTMVIDESDQNQIPIILWVRSKDKYVIFSRNINYVKGVYGCYR